VIDIVLLDESGFSFPLCVAWREAGLVLALSVGLATTVGLWPAWQATRISLAEALACE